MSDDKGPETNYVRIGYGEKPECDEKFFYSMTEAALVGLVKRTKDGYKTEFGLLQSNEPIAFICDRVTINLVNLLSVDYIKKRLVHGQIAFERQADVTVFYHTCVPELIKFMESQE